MFFFAFYLCIAITIAADHTELNDPFIECYNDTDCIQYHKKFYCYAGLCTDICPPGYIANHHKSEPTFTCDCDPYSNFVKIGVFTGDFLNLSIPKCMCKPASRLNPFCNVTVWSQGIGYTDGLVPKGSPPNCKLKVVKPPEFASTFALILLVATSVIFLYVNCQSCSWIIYDFHRYTALYILATIPLIVFVQTVQPFGAGFTRSMGFGVIIHNSAEWNLLIRLQYGKTIGPRSCANLCVMWYYIILLIAIVVLPLHVLLFVGMVQGGFLDFALLYVTCVGGKAIKEGKKNTSAVFRSWCPTARLSFQWGFGSAAAYHLLTVEILFTGFVLNKSKLIGAGATLLIPSFLIYTLWASTEDRTTRCCGPSFLMNYEKKGDRFFLKRYNHTTNISDLGWDMFIEDRYHTNMEDIELLESSGDNTKVASKREEENYIEDYENFMFGIGDECYCGRLLCNIIPIYWIAALLTIIANGALIYFAQYTQNGCEPGYAYGVW